MAPLLLPLHPRGPGGRGGGGGVEEASLAALPFVGSLLLLLLLLAALAGLYLWRQGKLALPPFGGSRSPEDGARRILAERFARGDLSSEEFLERASTLNWAPGSDTLPAARRPRRWRA